MGRRDTSSAGCRQAAYEQFVERGFTNVRRSSGDLSDWAAAGLPLEGSAA